MKGPIQPDLRGEENEYVFDNQGEYVMAWLDCGRGIQLLIHVGAHAVSVEALPAGNAGGVPYATFEVPLP